MEEPRPRDFASLLQAIKRDYESVPEHMRSAENIREHCRAFFEGKIFVSHTAADTEFCKRNIIPLLEPFGVFGHFFLSMATGDPRIVRSYRFMVEYSLFYCKTVLIILSNKSVGSEWCQLEAKWAVEQKHPIIICRVDSSKASVLDARLRRAAIAPNVPQLDFFRDEAKSRNRLHKLLQSANYAPPIS